MGDQTKSTKFGRDEDASLSASYQLNAITALSKHLTDAAVEAGVYKHHSGVDSGDLEDDIDDMVVRVKRLAERTEFHARDTEERVFDYQRGNVLGYTVDQVTLARTWTARGVPVRELYFQKCGAFEYPDQLKDAAAGCIHGYMRGLEIMPGKIRGMTLTLRKPTKSEFGFTGSIMMDCRVDYGNGKWKKMPDLRVSSPTWGFWESYE